MEEYKPILDFPSYEVSNFGNVRRNNKILKTAISNKGYVYVGLRKDKKRYTKKVHRLVAETFIPNPENKPEVDHIDRNRTNNMVLNLHWVTRSENCLNTIKTENDLYLIKQHFGKYQVRLRTITKDICQSFNTLEEAKKFRDSILNNI